MIRSSAPFPHVVLDDAIPDDLLKRVRASWPATDWPGWVSYGHTAHRKRASDATSALPPACGEALAWLAALPVPAWLGLPADTVPDLSLWGAGLHELGCGAVVGRHLDADVQPRLGLERRASVLLYVHERWEDDWGGDLRLLWPDRSRVAPLAPGPGRLVAFATTDDSYHEVAPVLCPDRLSRQALAMFWYGPARSPSSRPRACFASPVRKGSC